MRSSYSGSVIGPKMSTWTLPRMFIPAPWITRILGMCSSVVGDRDLFRYRFASLGQPPTKNPGTLSRARGFRLAYGVAVTFVRVRKRHTIIGANSFHGPVRDGKAWFQAAVAATWSGCARCQTGTWRK